MLANFRIDIVNLLEDNQSTMVSTYPCASYIVDGGFHQLCKVLACMIARPRSIAGDHEKVLAIVHRQLHSLTSYCNPVIGDKAV